MNRDECCGSGVVVISFLAGTVVGAAIALLTAPKSGRETREMIAEYSTDLKDKAQTIPDDFREYTGSAIERGKEMIDRGKDLIAKGTDIASHGKEYLDEKKEALNAAIEAGKKAMEQEKEVLKKTLAKDEE